MRKIVFTGPECTGKTTLVQRLSAELKLPHVPESAREYLRMLNRPYTYEDLLNIAMLQMSEEERIKTMLPPILVCDTDLLTIKIWAEDKYGTCETWLTHAWMDRSPEMYFLCAPDFPWEADPQREDPHRRELIYEAYKKLLLAHNLRFIELTGPLDKRIYTVLQFLNAQSQKLF